MIRTIDRLRIEYTNAINEAIIAAEKLQRLDKSFGGLAYVPTQDAIAEMNATANAAINRLAHAQHMSSGGGTYINAGGDVITVGNVEDSNNLVVGTDNDVGGTYIEQKTTQKRAKRDPRFKPPGK